MPPHPPTWVSLLHRRQQDARQREPLDEGVAGAASSTPKSAVHHWLPHQVLPQKIPLRHLLLQRLLEVFQRNAKEPEKTGSSLSRQRPQSRSLHLELEWNVQPPLLPQPSLLHLRPLALEALERLQHRPQEGAMAAFAMVAAGALGPLWALGRRQRRRNQQRHLSRPSHLPPHHNQRQYHHSRHLHQQCQLVARNNPDGAHCFQMERMRMTSPLQCPCQLSQRQPQLRRRHLHHSPKPDNSSQGGVRCLWRILMRKWKSQLHHCLGSRNGNSRLLLVARALSAQPGLVAGRPEGRPAQHLRSAAHGEAGSAPSATMTRSFVHAASGVKKWRPMELASFAPFRINLRAMVARSTSNTGLNV